MDFIDSAIIMVPALTGMDLTIYNEESETLARFESKYCFSPELQPFYTQQGQAAFLEVSSQEFIYDLEDPLGTRLVVVQTGGHWVLLGPYVEDGWNEQAARLLLVGSGVSKAALLRYKVYRCQFPIVQRDDAFKTALLIVEHLGNETRLVKTVRLPKDSKKGLFMFSDAYADAQEINRRYYAEDRLFDAIIHGDAAKAIQARNECNTLNVNLRRFKDSSQDQFVETTIERTMIRIAAKLGGLSPVLIDTIIQEFAQKMCFAASRSELNCLAIALIERFCSEIQKQQKAGYSSVVRQAMDYMEVNLSKPMTTAEIACAAGAERKNFTAQFRKETKMTVKEYLANRRCSIAAQLLLESSAGVQEVAAYVGYPDSNYFSKIFKANMGVSPQEYRSTRRPPK